MMTRHATSAFAGRASSMRRMRRRAITANAAGRPFCNTNGCASFLDVDQDRGVAVCPICGYVRRIH